MTLLIVVTVLPAFGQRSARKLNVSPGIPAAVDSLPPLENRLDGSLQTALTLEMRKDLATRQLISEHRMSVGVVDLRDIQRVRFASLNGDLMMYAASLPKIAILLAAMDALESHTLQETEEVRRDLRLMIARSDNQASTRMIDRLGYEQIARVLTDPRYRLYDEEHGGGLWVGKRYASGGRRYPDPLKGLSHAATVKQVCRFYYMLAFGRLVSPERSRQMLEMLADPELHHKFVNTLSRTVPRARLYRKSGTWQDFHSDSVLVWGPNHRFILVALVHDSGGERILRDLVGSVEEVLANNR